MSRDKAWKRVGAEWRDVVLVCRKCARKLDGGFGPDGEQPLAKALRRALAPNGAEHRKARRRPVAVIEVGCLDICPRKAVVVVKGSDPKSMILVPKGATMAEVMEELRLQIGNSSIEVPGAVTEVAE